MSNAWDTSADPSTNDGTEPGGAREARECLPFRPVLQDT